MLEEDYGQGHCLATIFSIIEYPPAIEHYDVLSPNAADYKRALEISRKLRKIGKPVGAIDILIASMCLNRAFELVAKDTDFLKIRETEPGLRLKLL
ncbi:PIN domain-containing protein [Candidatus Woesearchaeota archaeon]|nr:PIN domain-containing protein [Candidatus Woesearchaeota archaeon]